jgi:hypothetical protein
VTWTQFRPTLTLNVSPSQLGDGFDFTGFRLIYS